MARAEHRTSGRRGRAGIALVSLVLLGGAAVGWLLLERGDATSVAEASGGVAPARSVDGDAAELLAPVAAGTPTAARTARTPGAAPSTPAPPSAAAGRPREVPPDTPGATVLTVRLVDTLGVPRPLAGVPIETQSWLEDSSDTFRHRARTDADGVATFAFDGPVHVDWFKHDPSDGFDLPFLYEEHHDDVRSGERQEYTLSVRDGGALRGRIVDPRGGPLAGVEVHLFQEYYMGELADTWRPGIAVAVSGTDGAFAFPSLAAAHWSLCVPPFTHVQLSPDLEEGESGRTYVDVEAGVTCDVGILVVAPLARLDVEVTDLAGAPVEGANVALLARGLDVPGLELKEQQDGDELERWLEGEEPWHEGEGLEWSYRDLHDATDAQGRATLLAVAGDWELKVRSSRDVGPEPLYEERLDLALPSDPVVVRVPTRFRALEGRVVDLDGAPIEDALVVVSELETWGATGPAVEAGRDGRFRFDAIPADRPLFAHVRGSEVLPAVHRVALEEDGPQAYEARRAAELRARVEWVGGRHSGAGLLATPVALDVLDPPPTAFELRFRAGLEGPSGRKLRVDRGGNIRSKHFWPGSYRISVLVDVATGEYSPESGAPKVEQSEWTSRTIRTDDPGQVLEFDLSGYEQPQRQPGVVVEGVVVDGASGVELSGAHLSLQGEEWTRNGWSRAGGAFGVRTPDEPFRLTVRRAGYLVLERDLPRASRLGSELRLELEDSRTRIQLDVRTADGRRLPQLHVRWTTPDGEAAVANSLDGRKWSSTWRLSTTGPLELQSLAPGDYSVQVQLAELDVGRFDLRVEDRESEQRHELRLDRTADELRRALADSRR